ncbi:MAG: Tol-Pal system beta propeller repeat protein TolB, partial [Massilia sp.]
MKLLYSFVLSAGLVAGSAQAQLKVEIAGVGNGQIPVAVATFADEGEAPAQISAIIRADLERSGVFKVIDAGTVLSETANVDFGQWKSRGADALVVGSVQRLADGRIDVRYRLLDTIKASQLSGLKRTEQAKYTRFTAHKIADDIYEKLTGNRGVFATRVAYVNKMGPKDFRLEVADADGENTVTPVRSNEAIISPSWSPDGSKVVYVSFELKKPVIYLQDLVTGSRKIIANYKGNNSAPSWSPDGTRLALALTKDPVYQVYVMNIDGSGLRRLTNTTGIETEPQFSADGQSIYFTSDRSGGPQIYKMSVNGGTATRVTFNGPYNISPRVSPDGKTLAWVSQRDGRFSLYAMDLASGQELKLADDATEPSFAPNGKYVMYATKGGGRTGLAVVSVDGRVKQRLSIQTGNIREPSWG